MVLVAQLDIHSTLPSTLVKFGVDNGGGATDSNGAYYYNNAKFLLNTWKGSTTTYTITVTASKYYLNAALTLTSF